MTAPEDFNMNSRVNVTFPWDISSSLLSMRQVRVFVLGDLILDSYIEGRVERISPEAPVPVVHVQQRRDVLGGAGNVAANVRSLGGAVVLCGRLSPDGAGTRFLEAAAEQGIDTSAVVLSDQVPTTRKTRVLAGAQQIVRLDEEVCLPLHSDLEKQILLHFERFCCHSQGKVGGVTAQRGGCALVLSDYDKGVLTKSLLAGIIQTASHHGVPIVVDPKKTDLSVYRGATVIKPNLSEASAVFGRRLSSDEAKSNPEVLARLLAQSGAHNVVLSLSADGVLCAGREVGPLPVHFRSSALKVADVSGAGDTMVALLALGLAGRLGLERATELGNVGAGLVCAKSGTATITAADLIRGYQQVSAGKSEEKVIDCETAARLSEQFRAEGHTVVFTNGCFDLVHPGHVRTLVGAKAMGHFLFVGLNSDASVKRLKGPSRPVQDEVSRATVIAGLGCVDFVIVFDEDTPLDLIKAIQPGCLVKGGDYTSPDKIVGAPEVMSWGGHVATVPLVPGQSTTGMIARSGGQPK
jgi:D-beta-D-heptose 7-phosphate kinase/D-beta-D-heptose 1-phosphate adenosyltransferase